jgi:phosphotransferase system enzyme I (PtsP)
MNQPRTDTDVHGRLIAAVSAATSPAGALSSATRVVAECLSAEVCSIFVRGAKNGLVLRAHFGPVLDPAASESATALAERALDSVLPVTNESSAPALVAVPVASVNHVIGAIVARRAAPPFTAEEIMRLSGVASQIVGLIESARLVETIEGGGDAVRSDEGSEPPPSMGERILRGVAASQGIAIGRATFRNAFPRTLVHRETTFRGTTEETARARDAFEKTRNDLVRLQSTAAGEIGEEQALIFGTHLLLLNDPMLTSLLEHGIAASRSAAVSVDDAFDEIGRRLRDVHDPYIQERIEDIEDLRSRILGYLVGVPHEGELGDRLVVTSRTTPSLVVELKAHGALGIASELGGATSHGALLARALGVPAVTGVERLTHEVLAGDLLIIDGDEGRVVIRPTAATEAEYARRSEVAERKRTEFLQYQERPATTADGVRVLLQANIALSSDLEVARENGADGVGLYRTEFLFVVRDGLPTVEEQARVYAKAYETFPDAPVTLRLLDLAADKFLPNRGLGVSHNAFHGYRSIRILFDHPHVLRDQVQAFAIAASGKTLRILIPMVTSVEEVVRVKAIVTSALASLASPSRPHSLSYGAMIETAAAVEITTELAREVDFFSIGTNDLIQYALVVDREDPRMSSDLHAYHPAILRMIRRVVEHAHAAGKPAAVCGEMAARPDLAIALLAMGIDSLSVTPRVIPELKQALAHLALAPLRADIDRLLAAPSMEAMANALRTYVRDGALGIEGRSMLR